MTTTEREKEPEMKNAIELNIWNWQQDEVSLAQLVISQNGQIAYGANYVMGQAITGTSWSHAAVALAIGLEEAYRLLMEQENGLCKSWISTGVLKIYMDYKPMMNAIQRDRWRQYGAPNPPAPNQDALNSALTKWTNAQGLKTLIFSGTKETPLQRNQMEKWSRKQWTELEEQRTRNVEKIWNIPNMPITQEEVKQLLKDKQDKDEARVIKFMAEEPRINSIACQIYQEWNLDRSIIKECHKAMAHRRTLQVTFNNIVAATRFKTFEGSRLMKAICQREGCGAEDSWEHFQLCYKLWDWSMEDRKTRIQEIIGACKRAEVPNPARPKPSKEEYWNEQQCDRNIINLPQQGWEDDMMSICLDGEETEE